jgi:tRNA/rRNA methyltransferase
MAKANRAVRFVLVRPRDPNNIGAVARAMANFGLKDLVLAEPHPPVWAEARSAVGAEALLKKAKALPLSGALKGASLILGTCGGARKLVRPVIPLPGLGKHLGEHLPSGGRLAVLFGNEKTGLTRAELGHCHAVVRIPTDGRTPSMNLGQAAALLAYELSQGGRGEKPEAPDFAPAPAEQVEALLAESLRAFAAKGYMAGLPDRERTRRVRDALKRLRPCRKDAGLLLALLRRV